MSDLPRAFLDRPIAHRALHGPGRPENSRAAITAAVTAGYGIEIDLQLSADGQAMVFHDYDLTRMTDETGPVRARNAGELTAMRLTGGEDGMPTLSQVLDMVNGAVPLLIELKDQDGQMGPNIGALERATAQALRGYNGPTALMSFNPRSAAEMARLCPDRPRGLTTCACDPAEYPTLTPDQCAELRSMPGLESMGATFISHDHEDLDSSRVADRKARGLHILSWTIRSPAEEAAARRVAVNVTFEGYPA
jgi:glycerophosphoryl diester phosphodiesterase